MNQSAEVRQPRLWPWWKHWLRRLLGLVILLIAAEVLLYSSEVYKSLRLNPTQDPLFDLYARELAQHNAWTGFTDRLNYFDARVPDEVMAKWEPQFGADPRYWQLRVWNRLYSADLGIGSVATQDGNLKLEIQDLLRSSGDTGIDSASTFMAYFLSQSEIDGEYRRDIRRASEELSNSSVGIDAWRADRAVKDESRKLELTRQLAHDLPEEAWAHYLLSMKLFERGQLESGWIELKKGNESTGTTSPFVAMPAALLLGQLGPNAELPANASVCACMLIQSERWPQPRYIDLKRGFLAAADDAVSRRDRGDLQALHIFACRMGQAESLDRMPALVALIMDQKLLRAINVDLAPLMSREERRMLQRLGAKQNGARQKMNDWPNPMDFGPEDREDWPIPPEMFLSLQRTRVYEHVCRRYQREFAVDLPAIHTRFGQLAEFNFETCTRPDSEAWTEPRVYHGWDY
ncbi:hypothetical protein IT575_01560 [bacterium]|nr:hypothetical protein [bacterium]